MEKNMKYLRDVLILLLLVIADQITKLAVQSSLKAGNDHVLIDGVLRFTYSANNGAVWGFFKDSNFWLIIFSSILLLLLIWFYFRIPKTKFYAPLRVFSVFIMAGAIGNLIDRIRDGYVTDFIYFELIDFPVFNLADCYITVTCFIAIIVSFIRYRHEEFAFLSLKRKREGSGFHEADDIGSKHGVGFENEAESKSKVEAETKPEEGSKVESETEIRPED